MDGWKKKRTVMHRYNVTAGIYDMRYAEEQGAKIEAALKHVRFDGNAMILDVGCGTGILFDYVARKAAMVVGLDISRETLLKAKGRTKNQVNVHLILADADNVPLAGKSFNRVFAMTLIQNTPDPDKTLKEIKRVAEDEAFVVVTGLKRVFSRKGFEQLLANAGLKIVALKNEALKCYVAVCSKEG